LRARERGERVARRDEVGIIERLGARVATGAAAMRAGDAASDRE